MNDIAGKLCSGCSACACACPKQCIRMVENDEGFLYPSIDEKKCVHCGLCERVCPVLSDAKNDEHDLKEAYAAVSKDRGVLMNSSSGGAFTELAKPIIMAKGCVFGASFSEDYRSARHVMAESIEALGKLRGSKYIQSVMGDVYAEVKKQLETGRTVLFSGTPCQVAGLKRYLKNEDERLFTVDIACHGVPSAMVWDSYLSNMEKKMDGKTGYASFRFKANAESQPEMDRLSAGGKKHYQLYNHNPFIKMFLSNDCLRESCYECRAKENGTMADITIGDLWGIGKVKTDFDCSSGVSLIIVHTEKGRRLLNEASSTLNFQQVDYAGALTGNSLIDSSAHRPAQRDGFFADFKRLKWNQMEKKYAGKKWRTVLRRKINASAIGAILRRLTGRKPVDQKEQFRFGVFIVCKKQ